VVHRFLRSPHFPLSQCDFAVSGPLAAKLFPRWTALFLVMTAAFTIPDNGRSENETGDDCRPWKRPTVWRLALPINSNQDEAVTEELYLRPSPAHGTCQQH